MNFLRFVLLVLASICIFFFATFLNAKLLFSSAEGTKSLLQKSDAYPMVAAGIRDNIVKYSQTNDSDKLIEIVNLAITEDNIKKFVEDSVDQFYAATDSKNQNPQLTVHFSWLRQEVDSRTSSTPELKALLNQSPDINLNTLLADRQLDLSKNPFVMILININEYLIGFGIGALICLILLAISGTWAQKFGWLGSALIAAGVTFIGELMVYYFGLSDATMTNLAKLSNMQDEKFVLGVKRIILSITEFQKTYYLSLTIGLIVLGIVLIIVGQSNKKHDLAMNKI